MLSSRSGKPPQNTASPSVWPEENPPPPVASSPMHDAIPSDSGTPIRFSITGTQR